MGSQRNTFIGLTDAAVILGRTKDEVVSLCDEGLIRRCSTGTRITVHRGDVEDVRETNLNNMARPRDLVKKVIILEREVSALKEAVNLLGAVNGMLTSSLDEMSSSNLVALSELASQMNCKKEWSIDEMLQFSEVFLRISDSDIIRLNEAIGAPDCWRVFYTLCLSMVTYAREANLPEDAGLSTTRSLLQRGLRNLRSIGVMFVENKEFLRVSRDMLERTMGHDLAQFDNMVKKLKIKPQKIFSQNN